MASIDTLIERIYDASVTARAWSDVLPAIVQHCRARSAVLLVSDSQTGELSFTNEFGLGTDYRGAYLQDLRHDDLRLDDLVRHPLGTVRTDTMIPQYQDYRSSRAYRELYRKLGTEHALGAFIHSDGRRTIGLRLFRSESDGAFGDTEIDRYGALVPHLSRAFRLHRVAQAQQRRSQALQEALSLSPWRLLLYDRAGELLGANSRGRDFLVEEGNATGRKIARLVRQAIGQSAKDGQSRFLYSTSFSPPHKQQRNINWQLRIELLSLPADWNLDEDTVAAVALMRESESLAPDAASFGALYGLTATESAVAQMLISGARLSDAPSRLGMSRETAKTHLRHIFAKTDTNRQADLIRLALADSFYHRP